MINPESTVLIIKKRGDGSFFVEGNWGSFNPVVYQSLSSLIGDIAFFCGATTASSIQGDGETIVKITFEDKEIGRTRCVDVCKHYGTDCYSCIRYDDPNKFDLFETKED